MPHATESLNLPNAPSVSSPIPIPGSTNSYVRTPTSPYDPTTTTTTNNMSDYVVATEDGANYDHQFTCFSTDDTPAVSLQPEGRNMEAYYCYDYRCCNEEINNLHDFLQHVDTRHPGLYVDSTYGIMAFDASAIYTQSRLPAIPVYSVMPMVNSASALHDLKITEDRVNNSNHILTSTSKQKFVTEDATTCDKDFLFAYHHLLRDPSVTATTFLSGQTSGPSSISASYEDDDPSVLDNLNNSPFHTDHDPLLSMIPSPPLSLSSCPTTPVFLQSTVSSPLGLENAGISAYPILTSENSSTPTLGQVASSPPHIDCGTNANDQRRVPTSVTSVDPTNTGSDNSNIPLNRQPSYGSHVSATIENNSQNRHVPLKSIKKQPKTYGSLTIPNEKLISSSSATEHNGRRDSTSSSSSRTVDPNSLINRQKSPYFSSTAAENSTAESNVQQSYINVSTFVPATNYLQAGSIKMEKPASPTSMLPSNVTSTAFMTTTTKISSDQARGPHALVSASMRPYAKVSSSIDNAALASYIPSVSTAYSMNPVDSYPLAEYISGQTSPNSVMAKYQRIQPKTGISVSMADVYADPSLGCPAGSQGNKNSKKRGVSSSAEANKQIKRRASKSSEKPFETSHVSIITDESMSLTSREDADKYPHKCSVAGCSKMYKNANGLKYHNEHGHVPQSSNGAREKPWPCRLPDCQKAYGSKGGLNYHIHHVHPNDLWALP